MKIYGVLYRNGYSPASIARIFGEKTTKNVLDYLDKQGIVSDSDKPLNLIQFSDEDKQVVSQNGLDGRIKTEFTQLRVGNTPDIPDDEESKDVKETTNSIKVAEQSNINSLVKDHRDNKETKSVLEQEKERVLKLMKYPDIDNVCSVCDNKGMVYLKTGKPFETKNVKCPKCSGTSTKRKHRKIGHDKKQQETLERLIPNSYFRYERFDLMKLETEVPIPYELKQNFAFSNYMSDLERLLNTFKNGSVPKHSYILSAPDSFGKKHFIYTSIIYCVENGMETTPLYELSYIQGMLFSKRHLELEELLDKEVIFITLTGSGRDLYTGTLKYLLDYSDRKGIPIVAIARYDSRTIVRNNAQHRGSAALEWLDIFTTNERPYDYGHLYNVGILGTFARDIYQLRGGMLEDFIKNSPSSMKVPENTERAHNTKKNDPDNEYNI